MQTSVFSFDLYKELLRNLLTGAENRGRLAAASKAIGCQRPYLSRVLLEDLHLTPDHAFNLAHFFKFTDPEREYFMALVEVERAASLEYRNFQKQKIVELKKKNQSLLERTGRPSLHVDPLGVNYFSSWLWSALHFLTAIPRFQTVSAMSSRLGINESVITSYLLQLQEKGLIEQHGEKWCYKSGGDFHAQKNTPLVLMHHQNWRQRAMLDAQDFQNDSLHFTAVQTLSQNDLEKIKNLFLNCITDASRIAGPSEPEECVAITCDFFLV